MSAMDMTIEEPRHSWLLIIEADLVQLNFELFYDEYCKCVKYSWLR